MLDSSLLLGEMSRTNDLIIPRGLGYIYIKQQQQGRFVPNKKRKSFTRVYLTFMSKKRFGTVLVEVESKEQALAEWIDKIAFQPEHSNHKYHYYSYTFVIGTDEYQDLKRGATDTDYETTEAFNPYDWGRLLFKKCHTFIFGDLEVNDDWDEDWDYDQYLECVHVRRLVPEADFGKRYSPEQIDACLHYVVEIPRAFRRPIIKKRKLTE